MKRFVLYLAIGLALPLSGLWGQVAAPNEAGVAFGHWHTIVRDVEASKTFWTLLGGTAIKVDGTDVMKFPGMLVFMTAGTPTGGTMGTVVEHVGIKVPDGQALTSKLKTAAVKYDPSHFGAKLPGGTGWGYVYSPDDLRVELLDNVEAVKNNDLTAPIAGDHTHYLLLEASVPEAQAWYSKLFGAQPIQENTLQKTAAGVLPSVRLRFGKTPASLLPTKGRALDHIGFEVTNLQAFCKKLEASGVKLDAPYSKSRHKSFASAELTDPWGVSIELTEGLNKF